MNNQIHWIENVHPAHGHTFLGRRAHKVPPLPAWKQKVNKHQLCHFQSFDTNFHLFWEIGPDQLRSLTHWNKYRCSPLGFYSKNKGWQSVKILEITPKSSCSVHIASWTVKHPRPPVQVFMTTFVLVGEGRVVGRLLWHCVTKCRIYLNHRGGDCTIWTYRGMRMYCGSWGCSLGSGWRAL